MGANDLVIAAHAISVGFTLVADDRDFDRIPDPAVESWLADPPCLSTPPTAWLRQLPSPRSQREGASVQ